MFNIFGLPYIMQLNIQRFAYRPACLCVLLSLAACMVGPDFARPPAETAAQWLDAEDQRLKTSSAQDPDWWNTFNDPVLNRLIERAYQENLNLRTAGIRVLESRAQLATAIGNLYPQTQQAIGSLTSYQLSHRGYQASFLNLFSYNQAQLGLTASWELDFWGKFRRNIEAADAGAKLALADYDNALVSLTADVARAYITIRTLEKRLNITRQNVETQRE
ncbi:MAG: TolC family protein, partial [Methylomonas sp.]